MLLLALGLVLTQCCLLQKNIPNYIKNITETVTESFAETNKNVKKLESLIGDATETFAVNLTYVKKILNNNGLWASKSGQNEVYNIVAALQTVVQSLPADNGTENQYKLDPEAFHSVASNTELDWNSVRVAINASSTKPATEELLLTDAAFSDDESFLYKGSTSDDSGLDSSLSITPSKPVQPQVRESLQTQPVTQNHFPPALPQIHSPQLLVRDRGVSIVEGNLPGLGGGFHSGSGGSVHGGRGTVLRGGLSGGGRPGSSTIGRGWGHGVQTNLIWTPPGILDRTLTPQTNRGRGTRVLGPCFVQPAQQGLGAAREGDRPFGGDPCARGGVRGGAGGFGPPFKRGRY